MCPCVCMGGIMHAYTAMLVCLHVVNADMLKYSSARLHFSVCMLLGLLVYLFVCAFAGVCVCVLICWLACLVGYMLLCVGCVAAVARTACSAGSVL